MPGHTSFLKPRNPLLAGLLSLPVPGLGQLYNGQWGKTLAVFGVEMALGALAVVGFSSFQGVLGGLLASIAFVAMVVGDAAVCARKRHVYELRSCNRIWIYLLYAGVSLGGTFLLDWYLSNHYYQTFRVPTPSMELTLIAGDRFMAERLEPGDVIERGDVLVFHPPGKGAQFYVKRVIALPGESVSVQRGHVIVNGRELAEPYARFGPMSDGLEAKSGGFRLGPGEYWFMGDNRPMSWDSRFFGPIRRERISYRALYIYWASAASGGHWLDRFGTPLGAPAATTTDPPPAARPPD